VSLVETLVSMALSVAISGTVLSLVAAGQTIASTQPETADLQQRARVVLQTLGKELREAGAGLEQGSLTGPLVRYFPPLAPSADGGITIWTATNRHAQATVVTAAVPGATTVALDDSTGCPSGAAACAFAPDTTAIAFSAAGCRTALRLADASGDVLQLAAPLADCTLDSGSAVAEGTVRTYRVDPVARQLIRRDEATGSSAPAIDGVGAMTVTYYADAAGATAITGTADDDLRRVRRVRITLRFVASNPLLRIPDLTVAVDAAPRNLEGG
jgi:Tfp pilus assembly protein PilW